MHQELPAKFFERFVEEPNTGCWLWTSWTGRKGYGRYWDPYTKRRWLAHCFAYEWLRGAVPAGRELDHRCRVRCCVNPDHLEAVEHAVNVRRGHLSKVWGSRTHCKNGHEYTVENTRRTHDGRRVCRACCRAGQARYERRLREA